MDFKKGCIEQIHRLYTERLFLEQVPTDSEGRIRIDDWEMRADIQEEICQNYGNKHPPQHFRLLEI